MRFPAGETFNLHKKVYPKGVLDKIDTGYVRFTVEDNGLNDYYILFCNQEMVGALCEFVDGRQLCSKEALDHILKLDTEGLAETVMYTEDVIDTIKKEHPELFLSPETTEKFKVGSTVFTGALRSVKPKAGGVLARNQRDRRRCPRGRSPLFGDTFCCTPGIRTRIKTR
jgi:hypothetical protein